MENTRFDSHLTDKDFHMRDIQRLLSSGLFNNSFIIRYTQFSSIEEFIETGEDLMENPEELDNYIRATTSFSSWIEFSEAATRHLENQAVS